MASGNVFMSDTVDRGPWILWDRITVAANTAVPTSNQFFSAPIGGTKTKTDTNLVQGNRLPPPQSFAVHMIGFIIGSNVLQADLVNLLRNYYFEFKIDQKIFAEGPLHLFPGGAGVSGVVSIDGNAAAATASSWNIGFPSVAATRRAPEFPRRIPPNVYFGVELKGTSFTTSATGTGLDILCVLDGIIDRSVQ